MTTAGADREDRSTVDIDSHWRRMVGSRIRERLALSELSLRASPPAPELLSVQYDAHVVEGPGEEIDRPGQRHLGTGRSGSARSVTELTKGIRTETPHAPEVVQHA